MAFSFRSFVKDVVVACIGATPDAAAEALGAFLASEPSATARDVQEAEALIKLLMSLRKRMSPRRRALVESVLTPGNAATYASPEPLTVVGPKLQRLVTERDLSPMQAVSEIVSTLAATDVEAAIRLITIQTPEHAACCEAIAALVDSATTGIELPPAAKAPRTEKQSVASTTAAGAGTRHRQSDPALSPYIATVGTDPIPPPALDPEHPQRVVGATTDKVVARMQRVSPTLGFVADTKYDGERLLGRLNGGVYTFHSRNRLDVPVKKTSGVPEMLRAAFRRSVASFVIDAEILSSWTHGSMNGAAGKYTKADIATAGARVIVFDIMWINGHDLSAKPLAERRAILRAAIDTTDEARHRVSIVEHAVFDGAGWAAHPARLKALIEQKLKTGHEGLVVKPLSAPYKYGGTNWVKVKSGYLTDVSVTSGTTGVTVGAAGGGGAPASPSPAAASAPPPRITEAASAPLTDTLDCLVVGVSDSDGTLLVACLNKHSGVFNTIGFVAAPHDARVPTAAATKFSRSRGIPYCKLGAHVTVTRCFARLDECPIVEVTASRLVESAAHTCEQLELSGDARVVRLRDDKSVGDVTTTSFVALIYADAKSRFEQRTGAGAGVVVDAGAGLRMTDSGAALRGASDGWSFARSLAGAQAQVSACGLPAASSASSHTLLEAEGQASAHVVSASPTACAIFLLLVSPGRPWQNRGTMRECGARFGTTMERLVNSTMAASGRTGDVVGYDSSIAAPGAPAHFALAAAVLRIDGGRVAVDQDAANRAMAVVGALVRDMTSNMPGRAVTVHVDVPSGAGNTAALRNALRLVPNVTLHSSCR